MKRSVSLLLLGAVLFAPVPAASPQASSSDREAVREELNQFVQDAIRQGLLAPAGTPASGQGVPVSPPLQPEAGPAGMPGEPVAAEQLPASYGACSAEYPLDFSEFQDAETYADILNYRTQQSAEEASAFSRQRMAKAYISLDLGSEAMMSLGPVSSPEALALAKVAELIEGRRRPDLAYFQHLSQCHEAAAFWLGAALLADGKPAGVAYLDGAFSEFRLLPLQLRTRLTALVMPALDATGAGFLAQKLLASFDKRLVRDSMQLQFASAVYELSQGSQEAEITLRTFLLRGRFQEQALFSLMRHDRDIDGSLKAVLLDTMIMKIERAEHEEDVSESIKYVLEELADGSRYLTMLEMATRPNMQGERIQNQIRDSFVQALERDLFGEDRLRALAAIEALSVEEGFLDFHDQRERLYEEATLKAVRLGFVSLADRLSEKVNPGEEIIRQRAELAYRIKDYPGVFRLAESYPANAQIGLVAALSAISAGDRGQVQAFVSRLDLTSDTIIALIEHDASSGGWIVPERVYSIAEDITDPAMKERAEMVLSLRQAALRGGVAPSPPAIAAVPERLMSTRMVLEALDEEAN